MRKTTSSEATKQLAATLAPYLQAGDVIVLSGDLGAGKTQFVQGVAAGLGVRDQVTSPTFNILLTYPAGSLPLYHFDLYRLESADELDDIDYYAITEGDGVSLVEWGDKFAEAAPDDYLLLDFSVDSDGVRTIRASAFGPRAEALIAA